nr:glycosyltransferase family 2 protein [Campylobacter coli]
VLWFDYKKIYCNMEKPKIEVTTILQKYNFIQSCKITQKEWLEKTLKHNIQSFWFGWHGMINFNFLKNIKLKFFDYIVHEDNHFGPLLFFCSRNIYVMLDKIYIHRMRPNSIMDYRQLDIISTPKFVNDFFSFLDIQNAYEIKMTHRYISLFLIAFDLLNFIRNTEISNKYLFYKIFSLRLKQWQMSLMETPYKKEIIAKIISQIYKKQTNIVFYKECIELYQELILQKNTRIQNLTDALVKNKELILQKNTHIQNLNNTLNQTIKEKDNIINSNTNHINQLQNNMQENLTQLNQTQSKLSFQTKYGTAKTRIQNQLSYKLGQAMIVNSKSILGYIRMPFVLSYIYDKHKQEQKIYQEKIKQDPSLKLPSLEDYPDYKEALKEKECLTYKLGQALIKANKTWYKGGYVKMLFEIGKLKRES